MGNCRTRDGSGVGECILTHSVVDLQSELFKLVFRRSEFRSTACAPTGKISSLFKEIIDIGVGSANANFLSVVTEFFSNVGNDHSFVRLFLQRLEKAQALASPSLLCPVSLPFVGRGGRRRQDRPSS